MKDKLLNFLLIFLLVFLILNLFNNSQKDSQIPQSGIIIDTADTYTIPGEIKIKITNYFSGAISLNTCKDVIIEKDANIIKTDICEQKEVLPNSSIVIDYSKKYQSFLTTGQYFVSVPLNGVTYKTTFDVENPGFFSKFFTFFFYEPMYNLMAFLLKITGYSLGWAIIIITIIIRLLLLIPQHKMMVSQRKLQLLQPKIKEIQEKHKGNSQMLGMELMKLYKDEKVNPFGSCGLLLIQMPILIVIYHIIIGIQSYSNEYYLYAFLGEYHVSSISSQFLGIDLLGIGGMNGLILGVVVGILQYVQVKLSLSYSNSDKKKTGIVLEKKKDANDYSSFMPDPELMNKFMLYGLPIMIAIFTYTFFAGVGVYWGIGTLFMIIQQAFVNKILKK